MFDTAQLNVRRVLFAAAVGLCAAPQASHAQLAVIDVKAIAQAITQVNQGLRQIQALQAQLQNQAQMLQHLQTDVTGPLLQIDQQATSLLQRAQGLGYSSTNLSSQLSAAYPTNVQGQSLAQLTALLNAWSAASRQTLQESMQVQNQVALGQPTTTSAVAGAISASKTAAGQTAAIQSANQLLAALSSQLTQLQTLLITEQRQAQTLTLQQQAITAKAQADSAAALAHANGPPAFTADSL